ncbi:hypothetical protein SDC9_191063 [bioreactor metagenome]|uniref:Rho termination factor N-terminal domain-containing protein n=1 Tax=bioreactor metagenome TaxID=1076179 RepID=A0A645I7V3_9ZZZZ|nr:hypothetical protein [Syntrophomonadaceae bacterium]
MFKLQKENVIKIVDSSLMCDKLINKGFALVQTPIDFNAVEEEEDYKNMNFIDLKKTAKLKGIQIYKMKKEDLINALEGDLDAI